MTCGQAEQVENWILSLNYEYFWPRRQRSPLLLAHLDQSSTPGLIQHSFVVYW